MKVKTLCFGIIFFGFLFSHNAMANKLKSDGRFACTITHQQVVGMEGSRLKKYNGLQGFAKKGDAIYFYYKLIDRKKFQISVSPDYGGMIFPVEIKEVYDISGLKTFRGSSLAMSNETFSQSDISVGLMGFFTLKLERYGEDSWSGSFVDQGFAHVTINLLNCLNTQQAYSKLLNQITDQIKVFK